MSYQFYNDTATLKIVENGQIRNLAKGLIGIRDFGNYIIVSYDGTDNFLKILYTDVTVPSNVSATDLRNKLNDYLVTQTSINTTGLATSSKQQQMISLLQQLVNNNQPCGCTGYVQTILLA